MHLSLVGLVLGALLVSGELHPSHAPGSYLTPISPANLTSCKPQLLGIGAQKAGTSFLYGWVHHARYHPQLNTATSAIKETHFFNTELDFTTQPQAEAFATYLQQHFGVEHDSQCRAQHPAVRMEITPAYMFHPLVPTRVQQHLPEARFVVLLRDPAARALSGFNHYWVYNLLQQRNTTLTGEAEVAHYIDLLNTTIHTEIKVLKACFARYAGDSDQEAATAVWRCLQLEQLEPRALHDILPHVEMVWRSIYADQLQRWFAVFPPQRFLIWITEDFIKAPQLHMQQLVQWLGLNPAAIHTDDVEKALESKHKQPYLAPPSEHLTARIKEFLQPHTQRLLRVLRAHGFVHQAARAEALWPTIMHP